MSGNSKYNYELHKQFPQALNAWLDHARSKYPNEAAAAFMPDDTIVPYTNLSSAPHEEFLFDVQERMATDDAIAIVHSHPPVFREDGSLAANPSIEPTYEDMRGQIATGVPWGISTVTEDSVSLPIWWGDGLERRPLVGRSFINGITDCYSIIRDWHAINCIEIPEYPRDKDWWVKGNAGGSQSQNMYLDNFEQAGFVRVDRPFNPLAGDVFLCAVNSKVTNHGGVYIGAGLILHHLATELSKRSPAAQWRKQLGFLIRHKDLPEGAVVNET